MKRLEIVNFSNPLSPIWYGIKKAGKWALNEITGVNAYEKVLKTAAKAKFDTKRTYKNLSKAISNNKVDRVDKILEYQFDTMAKQNAENARSMARKMYGATGLFGVVPVGLSIYATKKDNKKILNKLDKLHDLHISKGKKKK